MFSSTKTDEHIHGMDEHIKGIELSGIFLVKPAAKKYNAWVRMDPFHAYEN